MSHKRLQRRDSACLECGALFTVCGKMLKVCCSRACTEKWRRKRDWKAVKFGTKPKPPRWTTAYWTRKLLPILNGLIKHCAGCGALYDRRGQGTKLCSDCDRHNPVPRMSRLCRICHIEFHGRRIDVFCSTRCRQRADLDCHADGNAYRIARDLGAQVLHRVKRREIYERDGWVCQICGDPIDQWAPPRSPKSAAIDHIIPIKLGGNHTADNCQAAHMICNGYKADTIGYVLPVIPEQASLTLLV
jgi:5-methylcytosine-specific restriction endonuclease McrA